MISGRLYNHFKCCPSIVHVFGKGYGLVSLVIVTTTTNETAVAH